MRIAWFTPLYSRNFVPTRGDIAFVGADPSCQSAWASEKILPLISQHLEIEIFHQGPAGHYHGISVYHYLSAFLRDRRSKFDLFFYQIEDSKATQFSRHHLGLKPGVLWLHHGLFRTRPPEPLSHSPWEQVVDGIVSGAWSLPESEVWPETNSPVPLREEALALGILHSDEWSLGELRRRRKNGILEGFIPHAELPSAFLPLPLPVFKANGGRVADGSGDIKFAFIGGAGSETLYNWFLEALREECANYQLDWYTLPSAVAEVERLVDALAEAGEICRQRVSIFSLPEPSEFLAVIGQYCLIAAPAFSVYEVYNPWLPLIAASNVPLAVIDFARSDYLAGRGVVRIPLEQGAAKIEWRAVLRATCQRMLVNAATNLKMGEQQFSPEHYNQHSFERSPSEVANELLLFIKQHRFILESATKRWRDYEEWAASLVLEQLK